MAVLCLSLLRHTLLYVISSFAIILKRHERKLVALLVSVLLMFCYCKCYVVLYVLIVTWVGLQCVIVVFSDHTHLLLNKNKILSCDVTVIFHVINNVITTRNITLSAGTNNVMTTSVTKLQFFIEINNFRKR